MFRYPVLCALAAVLLAGGTSLAAPKKISGINYSYPVDSLREGQSYGNEYCYVTLDGKTDVAGERRAVRFGLRESTNQKYYLLGWNVYVATARGESLVPVTTTCAPAYQESELKLGNLTVEKKFFMPFENGYLRSAHFLFSARGEVGSKLIIRAQVLFPKGVQVEKAEYKGHKYLAAHYPDGAESILWGSESLRSFQGQGEIAHGKAVKVIAEFAWTPTPSIRAYALSFAYALVSGPGPDHMLLNALFDASSPDSPSPETHLDRIHKLFDDSGIAVRRYLETTQLWTPDPVVNRGYDWAKVNQLRVQQEYKWGQGFSNNPPSDIVVGRDSYWYLSGSSYYAQPWSRKLLNLWFGRGQELSGKFIEYMTASQDPIFKDDYGLNINDNTPLLVMAAYQYYSLTGDLGFLDAVYPNLLNSANYILSQRGVGENNHYGLVWCTSKEKFVRGLCGWRNVIRNYNLSGAVTEVNAECYQALLQTAELAHSVGDETNGARLTAAAEDLRKAIQEHLRAAGPINHFYCLNINPSGQHIEDMTSDLLFPVLEGVADKVAGQAIMQELFSDRFWAGNPDGAGGIRTVSSAQPGYQARSTPDNYGLLGGVWPNVALWAGKAAAAGGMPDLALRALRGTFLLSERDNPIQFNVVAGEFPEYFDGDDLIQRGMPLSPFVPGIYIWAVLEGLVGISPYPESLHVNPELPTGWTWLAVSNMPYRGNSLSVLADGKDRTLYTTIPVDSSWKQVVVPESLQGRFAFVSEKPAFGIIAPRGNSHEVLAASTEATQGEVIDRETGRVLLKLRIPAGQLVKVELPKD